MSEFYNRPVCRKVNSLDSSCGTCDKCRDDLVYQQSVEALKYYANSTKKKEEISDTDRLNWLIKNQIKVISSIFNDKYFVTSRLAIDAAMKESGK